MPLDVTSDPDFMQASAGDQAAYLKSVDRDFAAAPPTEQRMYLAHIRTVAPGVQGPNLGGMIQQDETQSRVAGLPGGSPITAPATPMMANVAGGAIGAAGAGVAIPAAVGFIRSHPIIGPLIAQEAITEARKLPVVGKFIPKYAEVLPWLMGHGKGKPPAEVGGPPDATLDPVNVPEYAGEAPAPGSPENLRDWWKGRQGGLADRPIDRATMQRPTPGASTPTQAPQPLAPEIQMQQKLGIEPQPEPVAAAPSIPPRKQGFGKGGFGATAKPIGGPRRSATFEEGGTPAVQAGPPKFGDVQTSVPQGDMTNLLQKMLKATKKAKGARPLPMAAD